MKGWWLSLSKGSPDYVMLQRLGVPGRGISQGKDLEVGWASWGVQETESSQCGCSNIVTEDKGVQDDTGGLPRWLSGKESACQCKRHKFDPWSGKSPHPTKPKRHNYWACALEPGAISTEPTRHNYWSLCTLDSVSSITRETCALQLEKILSSNREHSQK